MSKTTNKKRKPRTNTEEKTFSSRRAAFRAAKRDSKIPMRNQPAKVLSSSQPGWEDTKMDSRNSRWTVGIAAYISLNYSGCCLGNEKKMRFIFEKINR